MVKTLHDVAAEAGVSTATVSLVLNGLAQGRVSESVASHVLSVASDLNYRPNLTAQTLRTKKSRTIALISDEIATTPFAGQMLAGAQDTAWKAGWLLLFVNTDYNQELESSALATFVQRGVEGVIYAAMFHRRVELPEGLRNKKVVMLDCFDSKGELDSVVPDEFQGASDAVNFLLDQGHTDIAHITIKDDTVAKNERLKAYRDALLRRNLPVLESRIIEVEDSKAEFGLKGMNEVFKLPDRPTAVFCFNDRLAMGAYGAIQRLGLHVGQEISLVGFDDQPFLADALEPSLTTVKLPHYDMGVVAAQQLLRKYQDSEREVTGMQKINCPLVIRNSVGRVSR